MGLGACSIAPDRLFPVVEGDEDFGSVNVFAVQSDGSLDPEPEGLELEVWHTFMRVTTPEFATDVVTEYRAGDAPDSDTLAYVYQARNPENWVLAANLATSDDPELLVATLIHEYAHILTLGVDEVNPRFGDCPTIRLDEGCAYDDSTLQAFVQQFWSAYDDSAPDVSNTDPDVAWDFYIDHEDDFVSDYAATNAVEDIAESFMTFVLEDEPSGDTVVARKLGFFWSYPDYVAIRERIRSEFADDLGLVD